MGAKSAQELTTNTTTTTSTITTTIVPDADAICATIPLDDPIRDTLGTSVPAVVARRVSTSHTAQTSRLT